MKNIYIILFVSLLASGLAYVAYKIYSESQKDTRTYIENDEFNDKKKIKKDNLLFFYADWCNHCQKSKPIWKNVKSDNNFQQFNLNFVDINGEQEENSELLQKYDIKEYPTIILEHDNKKIIFDANLTNETLMKFLTSVYN
tara:strand:+ start:194 stop:616 length:423 start_codon:yes stop_codon:yes gene_type:complete